jgi:hypothetical protein
MSSNTRTLTAGHASYDCSVCRHDSVNKTWPVPAFSSRALYFYQVFFACREYLLSSDQASDVNFICLLFHVTIESNENLLHKFLVQQACRV